MGIAPLTFTGVSSFSEDFQAILARGETVASLPLRALQNEKSDLLQRKTLSSALQGVVGSFTSALENLSRIGDARAINGSSSSSSKVSINSVTATIPAQYTISEITSVASAASETSLHGYGSSDAVSTTGTVRLTLGSNTYDIVLAPDKNNLAGLRDAINKLGAGVTASVMTTGSGATPNYLVLSASASGATTLSLTDDPGGAATALVTNANQGSNAEFVLNGVPVSKSTNIINDVVSGVAFTINATSSDPVTISLASDRSKLPPAINSLVAAYNSVVEFLDSQIGEAAGLLSGSNLVREASTALRQFVNFDSEGLLRGIADLGISLDNQGRMSFDSVTFNQLSDSQISAAYSFVGSSSTGLGSLTSAFRSVSDPVTGSVKIEQEQFDRTEDRLNRHISELTERITAQQAALASRLQAADTLLATLESQQKMVSASLEGLSLTLYGRKE
jgi:flagellar hook-associated protein 2